MKAIKNLVFAAAVLVFANISAQKTSEKITRKNIQLVTFKQNISKVQAQEITFAPGQSAPKHTHPCPVVGYIKSGMVHFQIEGQGPRILNEGDAFYEPKMP